MEMKEVLLALKDIGTELSAKTIRSYESGGLLPPPSKEWLGRGKGSRVIYADDTPEQAFAVRCVLQSRTEDRGDLGYVRRAGLRFLLSSLPLVDDTEDIATRVRTLKFRVFYDITGSAMLEKYPSVLKWACAYQEAFDKRCSWIRRPMCEAVRDALMADQPVLPATTTTHYVSGLAALNLPAPKGTSGDWHSVDAFKAFSLAGNKEGLLLAGDGEAVNTNHIYGSYGVYDCTEVAAKRGLATEGPVCYAVNHFRAILDLLYEKLTLHGRIIGMDGVTEDWLDTEAQKAEVLAKAAEMIRWLAKPLGQVLETWLDKEREPGYCS